MARNHPVDCGWSWMILTGCTLNIALVIGAIRAFGIYFVEFISVYEASVSITSLITGILQASSSLMSLPIMTVGLRYISVRQSVFIGGCLISLAFLLGSLAPNIEFAIFSHGFIYGLGFAMIHGPTTYLVSLYFDKRRSLANAILLSGGGFGGLCLAPIFRFVLDKYAFKGALLLTSGILLQSVVGASLLRPIGFYHPKPLQLEKLQTQKLLTPESRCKSENVDNSNEENKCIDMNIEKTEMTNASSNSNSFTFFTKRCTCFVSLLLSKHFKNVKSSPNSTRIGKTNQTFINLSLLRNPLMIIFLTVVSFGTIGNAYGSVFIAHFAKDSGMDVHSILLIVSTINGCDSVGRVLNGIISDRNVTKNHIIAATSYLLCSINLFLSFLYTETWSIMLFAVIHGLLSGSMTALTPAIIVDFFGLKDYTTAMGMALLCQGVVMFACLPIIGLIRDVTGSYLPSFRFLGILYFVSSVLLFMATCCSKRLKKSAQSNIDGDGF